MKEKIFITGATGQVGRETIQKLAEINHAEVEIIAGVRDMKKAQTRFANLPVTFRLFDFKEIETISNALKGIDCLFLIRPPAISQLKKWIYPVIDQAKIHGIKKMVFLSLQGVEKNPIVPHYKIERYIVQTNISYTFLRPSFFMQNLSGTHRKEIQESNEIFIPAGQGKTNFIDVRDIAEVAAMTLTGKGHENKAYELTGMYSYDYYEVAELLTQKLGRMITYKNPSIVSFFLRKRREDLWTGIILVMIALYTMAKWGKADQATNELTKLLGRKPITLSQFIDDYKQVWMG